MTPSSDEGSILPLVAAFAALALAVVLLATAASSLYLERKRLFTVADGAALAGAEAFELSTVEVVDGHLQAELTDADVRAAVQDYLADLSTDRFDDLRVEEVSSADGTSATVTLSARWRPPVAGFFLPRGVRIDVTTTARSVLD
jgi:uncharacterized membrane protein